MAKQDYIIGLDLGIASVGWACVEVAIHTDKDGKEQAQPMGLIDCGVRCFEKAELPTKDATAGYSKNALRRNKRSQRRTIARRANRMRQVRKLLFKHGLLTKNEFQAAYCQNPKNKGYRDTTLIKERNKKLLEKIGISEQQLLSGSLNGENGYQSDNEKAFFANVWQLRVEALNRLLTRAEFAAVICHLVKHRGYRSTRKSERKNNPKDDGMLAGIQKNSDELAKRKEDYTPAKLAVETFKNDKGQPQYRNKAGAYIHTFDRRYTKEELELIFKKQKEFENEFAKDDLCKQLAHILWFQKDAIKSKDVVSKVGYCTHEREELTGEKSEKRAPKHCYSSEHFVWISKLNNLKIKKNGRERSLTESERNLIKELPFEKNKLTFKQVRKELEKLGLSENATFNLCRYPHKNDMEKLIDIAFKALYQGVKKYPKIKDKFNKELKDKKDKVLNKIENILFSNKDNQEKILQELLQYQPYFSADEINAIANIELPDDTKKIQEAEEATLFEAKFFHEIRNEYKNAQLIDEWEQLKNNPNALDRVGCILSTCKTDDEIREKIKDSNDEYLPYSEYVFSEKEIRAILECKTFDNFLHLSLKCMQKLLPEMEKKDENGNFLTYDKACEKIYINHHGKSKNKKPQKFLPVIDKQDSDTPNNPVVYRTITQARKIINAIIAQYGQPFRVHIEMARELGKSRKDRDEITKQQDKNKKEKEAAVERFKKLFPNYVGEPKGKDILTFRLANLQHDQCIYCGKGLPFDELKEKMFEKGYLEIDHAIPYSRSMDNSQNNKVLACGKCNQEKGNQTPFEWLGHNEQKWREFETRVNGCHFPPKKKQHILQQDYDEEKEKKFIERNKNDTRYATRFLKNYLENNLAFSGSLKYRDENGEEHFYQKVFAPQGNVTTELRHKWGLPPKDRSQDDRHHALDAIITACATPLMLHAITSWYQGRQLNQKWTDNQGNVHYYKKEPCKKPWDFFREEVMLRVHNRVEISKGEWESINNPYQIKELLAQLAKTLPDRPQARHEFVTPLFVSRMAKKGVNSSVNDDTISQIVAKQEDGKYTIFNKKKKSEEKNKTGIEMRGGFAGNGSMIRIDVFADSKGKNHCEPIYLSQLADYYSGKPLDRVVDETGLPMPTDKKGKPMDFRFSLYPFDLIGIEDENGNVLEYAYYRGFDSSDGRLTLQAPDADESKSENGKDKGQYRKGSAGLKFNKYSVDILGKNITKIEKEERQGFEELFKDDDE